MTAARKRTRLRAADAAWVQQQINDADIARRVRVDLNGGNAMVYVLLKNNPKSLVISSKEKWVAFRNEHIKNAPEERNESDA